ncbi:MAG: alpha/beta hydrolase [Myxococcaceae bacterium]
MRSPIFRQLVPAAVALLAAAGCGPAPTPPPPKLIHTTYRIISGVSMGGMGAASLGFSRPERFDAVGTQGGPIDAALLLRTIDRFHLGGFCTLAQLEAIAAVDPSGLNDPAIIAGCSRRPTTIQFEHSQDFNHWVFTTNGGTFSRSSYVDLFSDLTLAYGSLLYDNPASPFAPPGVDPERLRHPPADFCSNPVRVKGLKNAEYNPTGKYDAITFCDGQPRLYFCRTTNELVNFCSDPQNVKIPLPVAQEAAFAQTFCQAKGGAQEANKGEHPLFMLNNAGDVDPCREGTKPFTVGLAVDVNGNGRRDYGEPILANAQERFDDFGADGCSDPFEDGAGGCGQAADPSAVDPNKDNYDADVNPLGTENDWTFTEGEPFTDFGLDGVAGSGDPGEGNGGFDRSPGRQALIAYDARSNLRKLDEDGRARISLYADGGIRDLFNFGLMAKQVFSLLKAYRAPDSTGYYRDFTEIPGMVDRKTGVYAPWNSRWKTTPKDLLVLYGKESPTDQDRIEGEGDHVGTASQAVYRFYTLFNWSAAMWPSLERPSTPLGGASASEREKVEWYESKLLGAKREYAVALPPGYELAENQDKRYPVLFMMHGYGMDPGGFLGTALITDAFVTDTNVKLRPMIMVFPSGRCCFVHRTTGARDCRETDDTGTELSRRPEFERECNSGTFYVNRRGYTAADARPYGDAFFELMDHIDQTYRTAPAADVEAR